ncbi:MAG: Gfo/Idh/MocA family oxidoreductase [Deltaproteobacteria bacterium]|nr:Gfo/Idh/MocA family oxidoreductase [Deltaproteobacteria bacterium]
MQIAIIGLGRAGTTHVEACERLPNVTVAAAYDPSTNARAAARNRGIRAYSSLSGMLGNEELDAVIICAPPADHVALALQCLQAGLPVLSEKPLTVGVTDALTLLRQAQRRQRLLQVASKFRHVPEVAALRQLLMASELGEPLSFEVNFCSAVDMTHRWNAIPARSGGGVIIDNGCHAFDIVHFLFGGVTDVQATALRAKQAVGVEDSAALLVRTPQGLIGQINLSWSWNSERDAYVSVRGTRGTVEIGWQSSRIKRVAGDWLGLGGAYSKIDAHQRMHATFLEAVAHRGAPWISPAECVNVVSTVEAAYRSVRSGEWERVTRYADTANGLIVAADEDEVQPARLGGRH